jgi:hypothetical protein
MDDLSGVVAGHYLALCERAGAWSGAVAVRAIVACYAAVVGIGGVPGVVWPWTVR